MLKALIDGDLILYSVGFASETRYYECGDGYVCDTAKEAKEYCLDDSTACKAGDYSLCREPVEAKVWKGNANTMIDNIIKNTGADDYVLYFTGKDNFRNEIYPEYKANRKGVDKPLHYKELREWLIKTRNVEVIDGMEADDALGIAQSDTSTNTCICTLDKDLDMIAGKHFNWRKNEKYYVKVPDGDRFFWTQVLTGDMTDNIVGLKGIGPKKAEKALDQCTSNWQMFEVCSHMYAEHFRTQLDMHLNGTLLWIMRHQHSIWKELVL